MNNKEKKEIKKSIKEGSKSEEINEVDDLNLYGFTSPLTFIRANNDEGKSKD